MPAHTHIRRPSKTLSKSTYFDLKLFGEHSLKSLKEAFPSPLFNTSFCMCDVCLDVWTLTCASLVQSDAKGESDIRKLESQIVESHCAGARN